MIGGGLLGLEAAKALVDLGLETHVVEFAPRLMAVQVDEGGGRVLRRHIESLGVRVHAAQVHHRHRGRQRACSMCCASPMASRWRPTSWCSRPASARRMRWRKACGITVGPRGGIVIDDRCRTSDADIYAIGECALWQGKLFGLVAPGYQMAEVAARTSCSAATRSSSRAPT